MKREVLSLIVECSNSNDGCTWKGEVRNLEVKRKQPVSISKNKKGLLSRTIQCNVRILVTPGDESRKNGLSGL